MGQGRVRLEDGSQGWNDWKLKRRCKVNFMWVLGHEGIEGNEKADEEAKKATEIGSTPRRKLPTFLRRKSLLASISATRQILRSSIKKRWETEWSQSPRHSLSSNIDYSLPSDNYMHIANQLNRRQASVLIQLRTGHLSLNNILHRIKRTDTPFCPHCGNGTRETVQHYLFFCPKYDIPRRHVHAATSQERNAFAFLLGNRKGIPHLLRYINDTDRLSTTFGNVSPAPDLIIHNKETKKLNTPEQQPPPPECD